MKEQEKEHLEYFEKEIQKRKIKPTYLLPLWDVMGVALGFGTAMLGKKAAMLCTASVEEVIEDHYKNQLEKLEDDEKELKKNISKAKLISISPLEMKVVTKNGKTHSNIAINEVSLLRQTRQAASLQIESGKKILIALGIHSSKNWFESYTDLILNWSAQVDFLEDIIKLSQSLENTFIVLRYKDLAWAENEYFKKIFDISRLIR